MSKKDIWQSVENPEQIFGQNEDLLEFNKQKGGTLVIENNEAVDTSLVVNQEKPMPAPAVLMSEPKKKESKVKVRKQGKKVINIQAAKNGKNVDVKVVQESPELNIAPAVVGNDDGRLGYGSGSPSMIRTGDEDPIEKMRECETGETPLIMPSAVAVDKKDEK